MLYCQKDRKTWYLLALSGQFYLAQSFNTEFKKKHKNSRLIPTGIQVSKL